MQQMYIPFLAWLQLHL